MSDKRSKPRGNVLASHEACCSRESLLTGSIFIYVYVYEVSFYCFFVRQVYTDGIRHIRSDKRVNEWKTPGKKTIVKCAVNERQVSCLVQG